MTFREIEYVLAGVAMRLKREHNETAWLAWHVEALARSKRLPKLRELMGDEVKPGKRMSPEQLEAVTRAWLESTNRKRPNG
jgi:hypothetical protein